MLRSILPEDRFFSQEKEIRKIAKEIYSSIKNLPILSPHGHVDPSIFVHNKPFPNPKELFISPDHYIFRMLYSQGIRLEEMDIPDKNNKTEGKSPKEVWQLFADNYYLFAGTPSGVWLDYEFAEILGIKEKLNSENAIKIYDEIDEKLKSPEFLPRNLFGKFNIEVLSTTDAATDDLHNHKQIKDSGWDARIIPCFRPDAITDLANSQWTYNISQLGEVVTEEIDSYAKYIKAIEERRKFFKDMGATSTDHAVLVPYTRELSKKEAEEIFRKGLKGEASKQDAYLFSANMLMEMARMSCEDGLTMQLHPGSMRNHNKLIYDKYGPDKGCDIPVQTEYTSNLHELLNKYGNNRNFTFIVFTLDETSYSRELAPLAGHYPAMKLGPAWWFHDSIEGMTRFREMVTETAGFYNTVGFNDDTRAFLSIPARHDVARRIDSNFLAGLVAKRIINKNEALNIAKDLTYDLVKKAYKL